MGKIVLLPTSHIAEQSLREIRAAIETERPDCVAVELDIDRYYGIKAEQTTSNIDALRNLGFSTFLVYYVMKKLQMFLGGKVGILPGSDMVRAVDIAKENKILVAFIDRDMVETFLRFRKIPRGEKFRLLWLLFRSVAAMLFSRFRRSKHGSGIDLRKVPDKELVNEAIAMMKEEFPRMYAVLVSERDVIMARRLKELAAGHEKVLAVIGAGHYSGLKKKLHG